MSLKGKLNRLKGHLRLHQTEENSVKDSTSSPQQGISGSHSPLRELSGGSFPQQSLSEPDISPTHTKEWEKLQFKPHVYEDQHTWIREVSYSTSTYCGRYSYSELEEIVERWNQERLSHPLSSRSLRLEDLYFFDTETTGLGGGTGNTIFLLGYSQVEQDKVKVKQFFLSDPSCELALYHHFLTDINDIHRLVTYNGKAFDWPQVKTRHTLIRERLPKLPSFGHFDLLHASRRLWKDTLPSCRLGVVENHILGIEREEDTPGYLAPMLYFDYLRTQDPTVIEGIVKHNELDVCSLISLYIHISRILLDINYTVCSPEELFQVGRWYEAVGETEHAMLLYQSLAEDDHPHSNKAKHLLAMLYKKDKNYTQAKKLWEELSTHTDSVDVYVELSKLYEHQYKDYEQALYYAAKAYEHWKNRAAFLRKSRTEDGKECQRRIERLELKQLKNGY
ncbi:ribonuclease H-like domain-containing protein [Caldalkalibacillus horti]|uniref:Uncharacterized protein YprB with RNaseH-like and TPR domain n=1 Tax=Caldalkalibacillus horti TaxID=77523 RepID=A0ABT9W2M8_9BACI|nr:ribonuclease H-like domain-containing protein [Bacillus horti]MDQ0167491.1 uncharacterized protein YprB with RNaseH-like and TPR domain [Bacillus horti]